MAFTGSLVKLIAVNGTKTDIPVKQYIRYSTYKCERNTMDLDPTRDLSAVLHRNPLSHTAYKIEFELTMMDNNRFETFMNLIRSHYRNSVAKDVYLEYYEPESNSYKTGHFYVPDISTPIRNIDFDNNIINYNQIRVAFIEY